MLVLARKKNQQIVIDDNIIVTVVQVRGANVRVGVEAPGEVSVHRGEVYEAITNSRTQTDAARRSSDRQ